MADTPVTIFWFRRDLRLIDNKGLYFALKSSDNLLPVFIFDTDILNRLQPNDSRVEFIFNTIINLDLVLRKKGSGLLVKKGKPLEVFHQLIEQYKIQSVFCNADHEPYGQERDHKVGLFLKENNVSFRSFVDHLIMEKDDVLKPDGNPYLVYTPYSKRWMAELSDMKLTFYNSEGYFNNFYKVKLNKSPSLKELSFESSGLSFSQPEINEDIILNYHTRRDYPAADATTHLGPHLRFGTISIRVLVDKARNLNLTFLNELIWREFYAMILWHFPQVAEKAFKSKYDRIKWRNNEEEFYRWTKGLTGYPMVDAGMRQMNKTGFMHNRLRMVTAGFLTKHLLIDWRWGQTYFADKLLDFELSSNNGGWQWCAGTGTDAAPYFRIFNPVEQQKKYDPQMEFIRKWIPELEKDSYPSPVVDHKSARERAIKAYRDIQD